MFKEIKMKGSPSTRRALANISNIRHKFIRKFSPLRGFFNKWNNDWKIVSVVESLQNYVLKYIRENPDLTPDQRDSLLAWESFQYDQKGPAAPIQEKDYDSQVLDDLKVDDYDLKEQDLLIFKEVFDDLVEYLCQFVKLDIEALKFDEEWKNLPSSTTRGYPFNGKGKDYDDIIIQKGGSNALSAIRYAESDDNFICFCGYRIQGKPYPGPAKVRPVYMVPVHSQYFDNGMVSETMRQLKECPCFCGWLKKDLRDQVFIKTHLLCQQQDLSRIQLDYSKWDKHIHPKIQIICSSMYESFSITGLEYVLRRNKMFRIWRDNQVVVLPNKRDEPEIYQIPYQLCSGEKRTQIMGSIYGLVLQGIIWREIFGKKIDWKLANQLGDDAVLPVPNDYIREYGYKNLLGKISEVVGRYHFQLNPKKAYPNTDIAFLQKLYKVEDNIVGVGSFTRSLASFAYKEKFSRKLPGVKNLWALELISQITILSDPFSSSECNIHGVSKYLTQWWIDHDDKLNACCVYLKMHDKLTENNLFKLIIKLSGATFDQILADTGKLSYDHTGLREGLLSDDYSKVFPILSYIIKSNFRSLSEKSVNRILNLRDSLPDSEEEGLGSLLLEGEDV